MEVMPGSHKLDQIPHRDTFAKHNLLTRGQEIAVEVDHSKTVRLDLEPGEISLHHVRLVHGSPSNTSDDRRIGFAIRYIPTYLRQLFGDDSASLVRGEDRYRHFELEPRPVRDMDPDMLALHQAITERNAKILYRGTGVDSYNDPRAAGLRRRFTKARAALTRNRHCCWLAAAAAPRRAHISREFAPEPMVRIRLPPPSSGESQQTFGFN